MSICNEGFRIIVDDHHHEQATAYFKMDQFSEFNLRHPNIHIRFQIALFAEALNVFSSNTTALKMYYDGPGEPLVICVEDEGIVFNCAIKTQNPESILDFEFQPQNVIARVILSPQAIKEIFRDFDQSSPTVIITITQQYISFFTDGDLGKIKVQIPNHSEQIERLECSEARISNAYRLNLIRRMHSSLALCNKASLRVDNRGVLSLQFIVPQSDQHTVFIEFHCVAHAD